MSPDTHPFGPSYSFSTSLVYLPHCLPVSNKSFQSEFASHSVTEAESKRPFFSDLHISGIHKHTCTHEHMHSRSELENCLVVICRVWAETDLVERQWEWEKAGSVCWNADKSLTLRQSVISFLSHAVCFHILSCIFFWGGGGLWQCWLDLIHGGLTVQNQISSKRKVQVVGITWCLLQRSHCFVGFFLSRSERNVTKFCMCVVRPREGKYG